MSTFTKSPVPALSIRQPWAWLIVHGFKDIENRSRNIGNHLGPILIHAGQTMTLDDYCACKEFLNSKFPNRGKGMSLPDYYNLKAQCGGFVGHCVIRAHGNLQHTSPWFTNAGYWYLLEQAKPCKLIPYKGRLGFFYAVMPSVPSVNSCSK